MLLAGPSQKSLFKLLFGFILPPASVGFFSELTKQLLVSPKHVFVFFEFVDSQKRVDDQYTH